MAQLEFDEATAKRLEVGLRHPRRARRRGAGPRGARGTARRADPRRRLRPGLLRRRAARRGRRRGLGGRGRRERADAGDGRAPLRGRDERRRCSRARRPRCPVADGEFDAALSVQVLEYVDEIPAALGEIRRALRPGGRVVLWDVDWATISLRTADEARMRRVLDAWDEHLADPSLPRRLTAELRAAGFEDPRWQGHAFVTNELDPRHLRRLRRPLPRAVRDRRRHALTRRTAPAPGPTSSASSRERGEFYFSVTAVLLHAATRAAERRASVAARQRNQGRSLDGRRRNCDASASG